MITLEDQKMLGVDLPPQVSPIPNKISSLTLSNTNSSVLTIQSLPQLEKIIRLLSSRNIELLRLIGIKKPKTLAELSRLSGRPKASLTRTLARLAALGLLVLQKSKGRGKTPVLACNRICFQVDIMEETFIASI